MGAVWYRARVELRRRWLSTLVVALLVALAGGAVLAASAGARRTASAYPRFLEEGRAGDVLVNPADGDTDFDAIQALPQVADAVEADFIPVIPRGEDGQPDFSVENISLGSDGRFGYELDRPVGLVGRMPDPDVAEDVVLSDRLAEVLDLGAGDSLPAVSLVDQAPIDLRVTGVGLFPFDALQVEENTATFPVLFFGPAATERWAIRGSPESFAASLVHLHDGDDVRREFLRDAQRTAGEQLFLRTQAETTASAERSLRPYVGALTLFAAVAGLAGLLVVGQALVRHLRADAADTPTLAALGVGSRQLATGTVLRAAAVGVLGAAGAVGIAVTVSQWMPVGPAGDVEPDPGIDIDGLVIGVGGIAIIGLCMVAGVTVGALALRSSARGARPSRLAAALDGLGLPPAPLAGVRMALDGGRGPGAVPTRTTLAGAATGLAALLAALTFAAGLDHLLVTPRLYGWSWDAYVDLSDYQELGEPDNADPVFDRVAGIEGVEAAAAGSYGQVAVDGVQVPAVGLGRDGEPEVFPTLLDGRPARSPAEVVLGSSTLRRIGRDVGDSVELSVGTDVVRAEVVGRATFPRLTQYPGADKLGLGTGAALTIDGLKGLLPETGTTFAVIRLADGAERSAALDALFEAFPESEATDDGTVLVRPDLPDDLTGYDRMDAMPLVLAGLLGVLAVGTTAHALVTSVRRRRHELATFKTIGFTRRQVMSTVAWQASTVAVMALLIGLPLGVAAGRALWSLLAERLGAIAEPVTPVVAVLVAIPVTLLVANLIAALPGRRAGRIAPAVALRSE